MIPVAHQMQTLCILMGTLFVSLVMHTDTLKKKLFTLIKCPPMSNYADQPNGCTNATYLKGYVNNTESTKMETFYGSIISTALEYFAVAR